MTLMYNETTPLRKGEVIMKRPTPLERDPAFKGDEELVKALLDFADKWSGGYCCASRADQVAYINRVVTDICQLEMFM
jgi:hypothetical protein